MGRVARAPPRALQGVVHGAQDWQGLLSGTEWGAWRSQPSLQEVKRGMVGWQRTLPCPALSSLSLLLPLPEGESASLAASATPLGDYQYSDLPFPLVPPISSKNMEGVGEMSWTEKAWPTLTCPLTADCHSEHRACQCRGCTSHLISLPCTSPAPKASGKSCREQCQDTGQAQAQNLPPPTGARHQSILLMSCGTHRVMQHNGWESLV